ncbi:hypothetical protein [Clostridium estertheticum]|uniref:hypothetical protein n=1 Tax=Clostridium estertheticum TaxID=238834 RepID=UPI0021E1DAF9|nr:hypothetical protein [Clostridium estertheticum]
MLIIEAITKAKNSAIKTPFAPKNIPSTNINLISPPPKAPGTSANIRSNPPQVAFPLQHL